MKRDPYNSTVYRKARKALRGQPCIYCGAPSTTVEHRIPLAQGGSNTRDNMAPACARCNSSRGGVLGAARRKAGRVQKGRRRW